MKLSSGFGHKVYPKLFEAINFFCVRIFSAPIFNSRFIGSMATDTAKNRCGLKMYRNFFGVWCLACEATNMLKIVVFLVPVSMKRF